MKRHEATLARRCPTCCAPRAVVCLWPWIPTTKDVPHPSRLSVELEAVTVNNVQSVRVRAARKESA